MEIPSKHDCLEDNLHWDGYHERRRPGSHTPVIHIHCAGQPDMVVFPSIVGIRSLQSWTTGTCLTSLLQSAKITGGEARRHKGRRCRGRGLSQDPNLGTSLSPKGGALRVEPSTGQTRYSLPAISRKNQIATVLSSKLRYSGTVGCESPNHDTPRERLYGSGCFQWPTRFQYTSILTK